jgi:hypothetical protein
MNLATAVEFQAELARLQAEIERLRRGNVGSPRGKVGRPRRQSREAEGQSREAAAIDSGQPVLTDAEREAIEWAARMVDSVNRGDPARAATLRGLLDRTETVAK